MVHLRDLEVAALTGISRQTLANQRFRGVGIPYVKVGGGCVRYALKDVLEYMAAGRIAPEQREG